MFEVYYTLGIIIALFGIYFFNSKEVLANKIARTNTSKIDVSFDQLLLKLTEEFPDQNFPETLFEFLQRNEGQNSVGFFDLEGNDQVNYYRYFRPDNKYTPEYLRVNITDLKNEIIRNQNDFNMLHEMLHFGGIGYWRYFVKSDLLYWSEEVYRTYDLDPGTFISRQRAMEFIHPQHLGELSVLFNQAESKNQGWDREMRIITVVGREKRIRTLAMPVMNEGVLVELRGLIIEHDKDREERSRIKQLENTCGTIFDSTGDLICLHSLDGSIKKISSSVQKLTGYQEGEVLGKPIYEFIHAEDRQWVKKKYQQAILMNNLEDLTIVYRFKTKNEGYRKYRTRINALKGKESDTQIVLSCSIDVTDC